MRMTSASLIAEGISRCDARSAASGTLWTFHDAMRIVQPGFARSVGAGPISGAIGPVMVSGVLPRRARRR